MAVGDVSWFVRQMQVQTSVTCVKEAYSAHAGTYELALASYAELASMLTTQATIDLSSEADFTTLIEGAKARLNVTGAPASFVAVAGSTGLPCRSFAYCCTSWRYAVTGLSPMVWIAEPPRYADMFWNGERPFFFTS